MKVQGVGNGNARGNSADRAARRKWLLRTWQSDSVPGTVRCWRCGRLLDEKSITVDRIVPGAHGGRYVRGNIRPACRKCNMETGGGVRGPGA